MTTSNHLTRFPKARSSTIAWLQLRDATTARLRAEIAAKPRPWAIVRVFRAVAEACRIGRQA